MAKLTIITGPSGCGKTEMARLLWQLTENCDIIEEFVPGRDGALVKESIELGNDMIVTILGGVQLSVQQVEVNG